MMIVSKIINVKKKEPFRSFGDRRLSTGYWTIIEINFKYCIQGRQSITKVINDIFIGPSRENSSPGGGGGGGEGGRRERGRKYNWAPVAELWPMERNSLLEYLTKKRSSQYLGLICLRTLKKRGFTGFLPVFVSKSERTRSPLLLTSSAYQVQKCSEIQGRSKRRGGGSNCVFPNRQPSQSQFHLKVFD